MISVNETKLLKLLKLHQKSSDLKKKDQLQFGFNYLIIQIELKNCV